MNKGFTKLSLVIGAAIVIILGFLLARNAFATNIPTPQVTICHATGSQQNPYNQITVNWNAVDGDGNSDHNRSGHQNGEDIIPPGFWDWNGRNWNTTGQAIYNNNCNVPAVTPTPTPTITPTPTDEPEVCEDDSALNYGEEGDCEYPEENPCDTQLLKRDALVDEVVIVDPCEEEEPTPTPTPTETPKGEEQRHAPASATAPVCSDGSTVKLPANPHVIRNGSSATVNFFITEGDSANVYWMVTGGSQWQHSLSNLKPNSEGFVSVEIGNLDPKLGYDFGVQQKQGCGGGQLVTAVVMDGPAPVLFHFSYWEWSK